MPRQAPTALNSAILVIASAAFGTIAGAVVALLFPPAKEHHYGYPNEAKKCR